MSFWDRLMSSPGELPAHVPSPDQDRELVLYKYDGCGYCFRVQRALSGLSNVEVQVRDTIRDPGARDELRSLTGRTQVPCLVIDGKPLLESADIISWLQAYDARAA